MAQQVLYERIGVPAGAFLFLGSMIFLLLRGNRRAARIASRVSGAFFGKWDELRLEKKVADTLAKAESRGADASEAIAGHWRSR